MSWHLLTGEYPPGGGGVGAYTALLAEALAAEREEVHVWAPVADGAPAPEGVRLHAVDGFGRAGLKELGGELDEYPAPRTLLVQYAPQAFGRRGMNVAFARWVLGRARAGVEVRVMFHEPFFPFEWSRRPQRLLLAAANRVMAMLLLRAARVAYVSTPAWERLLRPWAPRRLGPMPWLPIPSTIPRVDDPEAVAAVRARVTGGRPERPVVGHFGTFGGMIAPLLTDVLPRVLRERPDAVALLVGEGSAEAAAALEAAQPAVRGRIVATGRLEAREVSLHLQACDVAVQPYPDGASTRRTTLMAPLANGVATVTTAGRFTEPVWTAGPVPLAPAGDAAAMTRDVLRLLDDAERRERVAREGRAFYEERFSMRRTVEALATPPPPALPPARGG